MMNGQDGQTAIKGIGFERQPFSRRLHGRSATAWPLKNHRCRWLDSDDPLVDGFVAPRPGPDVDNRSRDSDGLEDSLGDPCS